ncbi:hypothetical protein [Frigidibacter sp. MR17.24]|uniref:hypothetical protein n=1 Tax=Frigidibacter sp. MR17.24 TaxID=3127345 RepID=UPI003012F5B6
MRHAPKRRVIAVLAPLALLAACATPPPECRTDTVTRLRSLDALIAETEGNLDRGFARGDGATAAGPRISTGVCLGSGGRIGMSVCSSGGTGRVPERGPRAIDPAAERAKLESLRASRARLLAADPNALALCGVALAGR